MEYSELIEKLREKYEFVYTPLPNGGWGYVDYVSEKYNLVLTYGSSNGDSYYILKKGEEILLHEDVSIFSEKDKRELSKIQLHKNILTIVRNTTRKERIKEIVKNLMS